MDAALPELELSPDVVGRSMAAGRRRRQQQAIAGVGAAVVLAAGVGAGFAVASSSQGGGGDRLGISSANVVASGYAGSMQFDVYAKRGSDCLYVRTPTATQAATCWVPTVPESMQALTLSNGYQLAIVGAPRAATAVVFTLRNQPPVTVSMRHTAALPHWRFAVFVVPPNTQLPRFDVVPHVAERPDDGTTLTPASP